MPSMQSLGPELVDKPVEACLKQEFDSDDYWRCVIRHLLNTCYHPAGTCKMGSANDDTAVVDSQLK